MIDPFTAFAMAQSAVKGIKSAMQLGKDVSGLYKEFSQFYQSADAVHVASTKMRMDNIGKTDTELSANALQIAIASKALRDQEKELKDLLFWSGNAPVWEEMQAERVRMIKERNAAALSIANKKQKDLAIMYETIYNILLLVGVVTLIIPVMLLTWHFITNWEF